MTRTRKARRRQRAMAARQALRLYEAQLAGSISRLGGMQACTGARATHITVITARTALRAAGLPPYLVAELRGRLRIVPEPEPRS